MVLPYHPVSSNIRTTNYETSVSCLIKSLHVLGLWLCSSCLLLAVVPFGQSQTSMGIVPELGAAPVVSAHPRISELCADSFRGLEGRRIKGFQLERVFIAVTPGHTKPPVGFKSSSCGIVQALEVHKSEKVRAYPELLSVKKTVRGSSSKSAFKVFDALPSGSIQCVKERGKRNARRRKMVEQGETARASSDSEPLSVLGVVQMIRLGESLARSYLGRLRSVGAPPGANGKLAETTGDVTLFQTLSAFLHGLLDEKQFVAADIAKVGADFCRGSGSTRSTCKASREARQHLHYFVSEALRKETRLFKDSKLSRINVGALLGELQPDVSAKEALAHVSNTLCAEKHHRKIDKKNLLPENSKLWSMNDIDLLFNISDTHMTYMSASEVFQSFAKSHSFSLLHHVDEWLSCPLTVTGESESDVCEKENDLKVVSVDSLLMLSLLSSLSLQPTQHVLPASRLVIEVFHMKTSRSTAPTSVDSSAEVASKSEKLIYTPENSLKSAPEPENLLNEGAADFFKDREQVLQGRSLQRARASVEKDLSSSPSSSSSPPPLSTRLNGYKRSAHGTSFDDRGSDLPRFVRVLYDGRVVTPHISVCADDPMSSLGLCSFTSLKSLLSEHQDYLSMENPLLHRSEL